MLPIGQVINSVMPGDGRHRGGAPGDDDLVRELLAGDNGGDDDAALATRLLDGAEDSGSGDAAVSTGDFGGLDIGAADFETPSGGADPAGDDADIYIIDDAAIARHQLGCRNAMDARKRPLTISP